MPVAVRAASPADLAGIVTVFLACWRGSYAAVLPARLVAVMTDERASALWTRALRESAPGEVLVAAASDPHEVFGVARVAGRPGEAGMVQSLYVSPAAQGAGLGSRLLADAAGALQSRGAETANLWVFTANTPAVAFYRRHGWETDGGNRVETEFGEPETRLSIVFAAGRRNAVAPGPTRRPLP